jgi:hypothetical protein
MNAPRRRFQFRLRTLMIAVTLPAVPMGYVGWEAKIVRERKTWLAAQRIYLPVEPPPVFAIGDDSQAPSLIRRWLGDEAQPIVCVWTFDSTTDKQAAADLFPEATVYVLPPAK